MKQKLSLLCRGIVLCLSAALVLFLPASANPGVKVGISDAPTEVDPDSHFVVKVAITEGIVADLDAAQFDIAYDEAVLHAISVVGGEIGGEAVHVDTWGYIPSGTEDRGRIRVICNQPMPTPDNTDPWLDGCGHLVKIHFDVVGDAGNSTIISFPGDATLVLGNKDAHTIPVDEWVGSGTVCVSGEPAGPARKGDFDDDGDIDIVDFVWFAIAYGSESGDENYNAVGDFDDNGNINILDFVNFAVVYGT